jgi:hypothetical protein
MGNIVFLGAICVNTTTNAESSSSRRNRGRRRRRGFVDIRLGYFDAMQTISQFLYEIQRMPAPLHPDAMVETTPRGRAIFESLRFSAKNHIPRLRGLVWRLAQDSEQLLELTQREEFTYKELCNLAEAIKDQRELAEAATNIATEHVVRELHKIRRDGNLGDNSRAPNSHKIRIWEAMVDEMNSLLDVMQDYFRDALDNVAAKSAEVGREREAKRQKKKNAEEEEPEPPEEDEDEEGKCLLCCTNEPLGAADSWVECPHCIDQVAECVCWECTLRIFKENDARCPFCGGDNELLVVGNFK